MSISHPIIQSSSIIEEKNYLDEKEKKMEIKSLTTLPPGILLDSEYDVLVLSGGGKRGILQLGLLHSLYTNNILDFKKLHAYVGTSVGSIVCFLLIINYLPVEILSQICSNDFEIDSGIKFMEIISNFGIQSSDVFFNIVEKITVEKLGFIPTMIELYELFGKYFICVTHNLSANMRNGENETVYIDHISHPNLSCVEAIKMSSNIPLVFGKYIYDKNYYIDGAITDNYPIAYAHKIFCGKKILGICAEKTTTVIKETSNVNIIDYMKCLIDISHRMNSSRSCKFSADNVHSVVVTIDEGDEFRFDISPAKNFHLFSLGYQSGIKLIPKKDIKQPIVIHRRKEKMD